VVVAAVTALTTDHGDRLPAGTIERAEAHMVDLAQLYDVAVLRRLGKALFDVVCPQAAEDAEGAKLAKEDAEARRTAYLSLRDNGDGTSSGRFKLPTLHAALLKKALEALTSPRRIGKGRVDPETGKKLAHSTLLGHGLMDLVEHHLDLASLPGSHGSPFTLVVTMTLQSLLEGTATATLEGGERISAGQARRLACHAGIIPLVLGGDSMPLDVGREQRLHTRYQRIAANHRHQGCAARNCDRPPSWVEFHHEIAWADGGHTDLEHALPLCPPHHHMADHPHTWQMTRHPDRSVHFTRRQ
jgi:hypothetical protein